VLDLPVFTFRARGLAMEAQISCKGARMGRTRTDRTDVDAMMAES